MGATEVHISNNKDTKTREKGGIKFQGLKLTIKIIANVRFCLLHCLLKYLIFQNMFELTLSQALGMSGKKDGDPIGASKLNKVDIPPLNSQ